jgi:hypothetical protein
MQLLCQLGKAPRPKEILVVADTRVASGWQIVAASAASCGHTLVRCTNALAWLLQRYWQQQNEWRTIHAAEHGGE